ncbi:GYD domain-containing protein [Halomarina oriensis]|uniref:GYD domain-containing protein n=1 Tax=Halomarina oriensis TaxID=671145 RepID=A0A6B0GQS3_9EURY|nr:GYD domain-containing protein [Halomarina oriensis]MWG34475.1 GYD domain-containing protein [Halomarina oriensis]
MPTYVVLVNWTEDGMEALDESPGRLDSAKDLAESLGGEVNRFLMTMGEYDMVVEMEMPDDAAMATMALSLGRGGAVSTETLKAFTEDEYRDIVDGLP